MQTGFFHNLKPSHRLAIIISAIVVLWVLSGVLFGSGNENEAQTEKEEALTQVRVARLEAVEKDRTILLFGSTEARRHIGLIAESTGMVTEILAEEGSLLEAGDPILQIDPEDLPERLAEAKARLKQRSIEYKASQRLGKQGYTAEVRLAEAKANLEQAQAELARAEIALNNTIVQAPFAGIVDEIPVDVGDFITSSGGGFKGEPVATFLALDPITVIGQVAEQDAQKVTPGALATVRLPTGLERQGPIRFIARSADHKTRTYRVEVEVPNEDGRIIDGLTAEIEIPTGKVMAHRVSPSVLSLNDAGDIGVKTVNERQRVRFFPIELVDDSLEGIWITGLPETVDLITLGHAFVSVDEKVKPVYDTGNGS